MAQRPPYQREPTVIKKTFLISRKTNKRFRLNGIKESSRLPEKACLRKDFSNHVIFQPSELPPKVDLRPWMTRIEDQSDANSCTANAMAGAYEYLNNRDTGCQIDVSRLFIYYNSRVKSLAANEKLTDDGSSISDAVETMEGLGVCLESQWAYDLKKVNVKPPQGCYAVAANYTISEAHQVDIDLDEMKASIAQGFPIIISLNLYTSFDKAADTGIVPMPKANETSRSGHGRHALLVSGYSDASDAFIVRNSWGEDWGDRGYCYIPYGYIGDDKLCNAAWTVKKLGADQMGTDAWDVNDDINYRQGEYSGDEDEYEDDEAGIEEIEEEDQEIRAEENDNDDGDGDGDDGVGGDGGDGDGGGDDDGDGDGGDDGDGDGDGDDGDGGDGDGDDGGDDGDDGGDGDGDGDDDGGDDVGGDDVGDNGDGDNGDGDNGGDGDDGDGDGGDGDDGDGDNGDDGDGDDGDDGEGDDDGSQ